MRSWLLVLAGAVGASGLWFLSTVGRPRDSAALAPLEPADTGSSAELERLRRRVAELEAELQRHGERRQHVSEEPLVVDELAVEPAPDPAVPVGREVAHAGADEMLRALRALDPNDQEARRQRSEQAQALRERFLELHPDHPEAVEVLEDLAGQAMVRPADARAILERHGSRVPIEPWRLDGLYANAHSQGQSFDTARAAYDRVLANAAAPDRARTNAGFFRAYTYMQAADYAAARRAFEDLIAEYEGREPKGRYESIVSGARNQLEIIEKQSKGQ
jgi:tetratricopeptide (TPR) repeat protein